MKRITINGKSVFVALDRMTYEQIVSTSLDDKPCPPDAAYSIAYSVPRHGDSRRSGTIYRGRDLELEDDMHITCMITGSA